jgi:glycosyltransferase involved in cell wall biosynthesis
VTDRPLLTVAIPTCNGACFVAEAVQSVLSQRDVGCDIHIHDDRSDDDTIAVIRSIAGDRARVEINSERLGLAGNWNRCVEASRTPFVAVFHQDDMMLPGHLQGHEAVIKADPDLGFVCGASKVIDENGAEVPPSVVGRVMIDSVDRLYEPGAFLAELTAFNPLRCSAVTLSKSVHAAVGGFDPSYRYVVDWDYWIRAARRHSVAWLASESVAIRWHSSSETHRFKAGTADLDESIRLLDTLSKYPEIDAKASRPLAGRRLARAFLNRAYDAAKMGDRALMMRALMRGISLDRGIIRQIAIDPRLAARLAASFVGSAVRIGPHSGPYEDHFPGA